MTKSKPNEDNKIYNMEFDVDLFLPCVDVFGVVAVAYTCDIRLLTNGIAL